MRSWVWTSPSSVKVFEAGWCVVARPALLYPPCARRSVLAAMYSRILPGGGAQIGWVGWLRGTLYRV